MPTWIHDRAQHLLAKNPEMSKSTAFAIATQQSHKLGKTPKGYGTAEGKRAARSKYNKPRKEYKRAANPGGLGSPKLAAKDVEEGRKNLGRGLLAAGGVTPLLMTGLTHYDTTKPPPGSDELYERVKKQTDVPIMEHPGPAVASGFTPESKGKGRISSGGVPLPGDDSALWGSKRSPAILAHEIGHAELHRSRLGRVFQNPVTIVAAKIAPLLAASGGLLLGGADDDDTTAKAIGGAAAVGAGAVTLNQLGYEGGASWKGMDVLRRSGATPAQLSSARKLLAKAFGSYLGQSAAILGAGLAAHDLAKDSGGAESGEEKLSSALDRIRLNVLQKESEFGGPGPHTLPDDHVPGVLTPKGGASCANCKYAQAREDGPHCTNEHYQQWAGTSELIDPATGKRVMDPAKYCSDWWESNTSEAKEKVGAPTSLEAQIAAELRQPTPLEKLKTQAQTGAMELSQQPNKSLYLARKAVGALPVPVQAALPSFLHDKLGAALISALDKMAERAKEKGAFGYSTYGGNKAENPPGAKTHSQLPAFYAPPLEKKGFTTSQYSGPLSYGRFKMVSGIPPFKQPALAAKSQGEGLLEPWMVGHNKSAGAIATTPAGRLAKAQTIGKPKLTTPPGPSIADISKPIGFGKKLPGATKNRI